MISRKSQTLGGTRSNIIEDAGKLLDSMEIGKYSKYTGKSAKNQQFTRLGKTTCVIFHKCEILVPKFHLECNWTVIFRVKRLGTYSDHGSGQLKDLGSSELHFHGMMDSQNWSKLLDRLVHLQIHDP